MRYIYILIHWYLGYIYIYIYIYIYTTHATHATQPPYHERSQPPQSTYATNSTYYIHIYIYIYIYYTNTLISRLQYAEKMDDADAVRGPTTIRWERERERARERVSERESRGRESRDRGRVKYVNQWRIFRFRQGRKICLRLWLGP